MTERAGSRRPWALAAALAAVAVVVGSVAWPRAFGALLSPVCHQIAERSLLVGGKTMAVCARCAGLYLGAALGLAAFAVGPVRRIRHAKVLLSLTLAPIVVDVLLGAGGLPSLPNAPRGALAVPAGLVLGMLLGSGLESLRAQVRN